ncbi:Pentatricopeptide repeat protein [Penicillium digitatum]|uniref:Pentatricopeptide repeat protein n=3 Tax=Penicillium digitatum TaxID=36651 RepID=K9GYG9_PEND2|nr:Pentatricopeptide repeat protein [Penicillium digitatum Pd1]EKV19698.1 Pentatricopeptide repeat protein [Penicillium digitatum PHI26]EKV20810.1 Pentatricopeptide repeat protein [Penicillium digitatum Pd1]QQK44782.1 Pentatricopeptide repeat protein [Penicillium digitatum]
MPPSKPPSHTSSVRRLCPRRPRPSVASIADIFVGSLVLASFCHEHSPNRRGFSTVAWGASDHNLQKFQSKGTTSRRQLPPQRPPEYSSSRFYLSQSKRFISNGLARTNDENKEEYDIETESQEEMETDNDYIPLWPATNGDAESQTHRERFDFTYDFDRRIEIKERTKTDIDLKLPDRYPRQSFPSWLHPEKEKHLSTSKLYERSLRDYNWEEAVNAVVPYSRYTKTYKDESHDQMEIHSVEKLVRTLWEEPNPSTQYLFRLYRDIPAPGVALLSKRTRGALLRLFAHPRDRRWVDARRYLALVDDMVTARLPLSRSLWSSAIHLSGRANGRVLKRDLIRAVGMWQKMEHIAGVKADEVVFNILFDIAIKAGAFKVADRLEEEMTERGLSFSRCGKTSKIYYFGMMRDVEGIRETFDDFVKSGEIVDTVVMNCLIASFLRAGDTQTAEQLYARMLEKQSCNNKRLLHSDDGSHDGGSNLSYDMPQYRERSRKLGRVLKKSSALKEKFPEYHRALQDSLSIAPDTRTFYIFLRHYAYNTGQLDSFMAVMRDMEKTFVVPPRAIIYLFLFEGFALHGRRKKQWSAENLRLTWHAYIRALRDSNARLRGLNLNNRKMKWENPLAKSVTLDVEEPPVTDSPNGLYMALPTEDTVGYPGEFEKTAEGSAMDDSQDNEQDAKPELDENEDETTEIEELDVDEVFNPRLQFPGEAEQEELWDPEQRLENGLFVGRRMITIILQAFGTCCGPKEVLEVWLQLERLWHPQQRKAIDVFAVKEELDKQMSRDPHRSR